MGKNFFVTDESCFTYANLPTAYTGTEEKSTATPPPTDTGFYDLSLLQGYIVNKENKKPNSKETIREIIYGKMLKDSNFNNNMIKLGKNQFNKYIGILFSGAGAIGSALSALAFNNSALIEDTIGKMQNFEFKDISAIAFLLFSVLGISGVVKTGIDSIKSNVLNDNLFFDLNSSTIDTNLPYFKTKQQLNNIGYNEYMQT